MPTGRGIRVDDYRDVKIFCWSSGLRKQNGLRARLREFLHHHLTGAFGAVARQGARVEIQVCDPQASMRGSTPVVATTGVLDVDFVELNRDGAPLLRPRRLQLVLDTWVGRRLMWEIAGSFKEPPREMGVGEKIEIELGCASRNTHEIIGLAWLDESRTGKRGEIRPKELIVDGVLGCRPGGARREVRAAWMYSRERGEPKRRRKSSREERSDASGGSCDVVPVPLAQRAGGGRRRCTMRGRQLAAVRLGQGRGVWIVKCTDIGKRRLAIPMKEEGSAWQGYEIFTEDGGAVETQWSEQEAGMRKRKRRE
ncbi:hypothetical protein DFH09DRAFT_1069602 [Mycena vulgaris]|nr:hypothetical protein DFH09DRAFT_1069602 [Mycena vulgaris]